MIRGKWKPESKVSKCEHCDREFYYLFRTKHHCRKCGLVVCSEYDNYNCLVAVAILLMDKILNNKQKRKLDFVVDVMIKFYNY